MQYESRAIRIADLVVTRDTVANADFKNCVLIGPAVVVLQGSTTVVNSGFAGPADLIFWTIEPERPAIVGAVAFLDCTFESCSFDRVGFAGPAELKSAFPSGEAE